MQPWNPDNQGNGQPAAGTPMQTYIVQPVATQAPPAPAPQPAPALPAEERPAGQPSAHDLIIISHSNLIYWWPVWVVGFIMTALTWWHGERVEVGGHPIWFHPNGSLGVVFFATIFLVVLITNISVRGMASAMVILAAVLVVVLLAFFNVWDDILGWLGALRIHLNVGAYFWFSTLMFAVWALSVFVFDRFSYWRVQPGQVTQEFLIGAATRTYDTKNLILEKRRDDIFRHWILGLGSGDLHMKPFGARTEDIEIPNVMFVGYKIDRMMQLINTEPADMT